MSTHFAASELTLAAGAGLSSEGSLRGSLRAWLARLIDAAPEELRATAQERAALATPFENRVRKLRAEAHAAFRAVEGARPVEGRDAAALDTALDVIETEWRAAVAEQARCGEALKAVRVYSPDSRCRAIAAQGLSGGALPRATRHASGVDRFPFADEPDA